MTQYKFEISELRYTDTEHMKSWPYKSILLDGKEIFRLDKHPLQGKYFKDQTKEVLEELSHYVGKSVTKDDLQRAITFGYLEI